MNRHANDKQILSVLCVLCLICTGLAASLRSWSASPRTDIDSSGRVDHRDVLEFVRYWNTIAHQRSDVDGDDVTSEPDLQAILATFHHTDAASSETDLHYGEARVGRIAGAAYSEYRFMGTANNTFSIVVDALGTLNVVADLISPASEILMTFGTTTTTNRDAVLDEFKINTSGMHRIRIRSVDKAEGYFGIGLSDRPVETPVGLSAGEPLDVSLSPLADDDLYAFMGQTGQTVRVIVSRDSTTLTTTLSAVLIDPSGTAIKTETAWSIPGSSGGDAGSAAFEMELPATGLYTLLVDSELGPGGGGYNVAYYVRSETELPIAGMTEIEGEIDRADYYDFPFSGVAGQFISAAVDLVGNEWEAALELIQLNGSTETVLITRDRITDLRLDERNSTVETRLPATGNYLLRVRSNNRTGGANAGRFILYVSDYNTPPRQIAYGDVIEDEILPIADDDIYTFEGSANDRMRIVGIRRDGGRAGTVSGDMRATLYDPDGTAVPMNVPNTRAVNPSIRYAGDDGGFLLESVLPKTGTYTLVVDSELVYGAGAYKFWLFKGLVTRRTVSPGEIIRDTMNPMDVKEYQMALQANDVISVQVDALQERFVNQFLSAPVGQWDADLDLYDFSDQFNPKTIANITTGEDAIYEDPTRLTGNSTHLVRVFEGRGTDYTTAGDFVIYFSDWTASRNPMTMNSGDVVRAAIAPIANDDFYKFTAVSGETIHILGRVDDPNRDPQLRGTLYDPQGKLVTAGGITNPNKRITGDTNGFELKFDATQPGEHQVMVDLDERVNFRTSNYRVELRKELTTTTAVNSGAIVRDYLSQNETKVYEFTTQANDVVSLWIDAVGTPAGLRGEDALGLPNLRVQVFDKNNILGGPVVFANDVAGGNFDFRIENWRAPSATTYQVVVQQETTGNGQNAVGALVLYLSDHASAPRALTDNVYVTEVIDPFVDDDVYEFNAAANDVVTLRAERPGSTLTTDLRVVLFGPGRGGTVRQTGTAITAPPALVDAGGAAINDYTIPQAGTYYVIVDQETAANISTTDTSPGRGVYQLSLIRGGAPSSVDEDSGGPVATTMGTSLGGHIGFAGDTDSYEFTVSAAQAGKPISIFVQGHQRTGLGENIKPQLTLLRGGSELVSGIVTGNNARIDDFILSQEGTYAVRVSAEVPTVGVYGLGISDLASETPTAITSGNFQVAAIERLNDEDDFTFMLQAGDKVDLALRRSDQSGPLMLTNTLTLIDPTGGQVQVTSAVANPSLLGVKATSSGEYRARVEVDDYSGGNYLMEVNIASASPASLPIAFGQAVVGGLIAQEEQALYTFDATAESQGKQVSILAMGLSLNTLLQLQDPDGVVIAQGQKSGLDSLIDDVALAKLGTYTIRVGSLPTDRSGRFVLGLSDAPVQASRLIGIGAPMGGTLAPLADEDWYHFTGTAGTRVTIDLDTAGGNDDSMLDSNLTIRDASGKILSEDSNGLSSSIGNLVLAADGNYGIRVEPSFPLTTGGQFEGSYTLSVVNTTVVPAASEEVAFGTETPGELLVPGQTDVYRINVLDAHQHKTTSLVAAGDSAAVDLVLTRPGGGMLLATPSGSNAGIDDLALDVTGEYILSITGRASDPTGRYRLGISDLPIEPTMVIGFDEIVAGSITPLADEDDYLFENTGTTVSIGVISAPETQQQVDANLSLFDPAGNLIAQQDTGVSPVLSNFTLPGTGTYRIRVEPEGVTVGAYTLAVGHIVSPTRAIGFGEEAIGRTTLSRRSETFELIVSASEVGKRVSILALGISMDTDLSLYNPGGSRVAFFDSSSNSLIDDFLLTEAGVWQIVVTGGAANPVGEYRIGASDQPTEEPEPLRTVGRALDYIGDEDLYSLYPLGRPMRIKVTAQDPTTMDLNLRIYGPRGNLVAESIQYDNSADGRDGTAYTHTGIIERLVLTEGGMHTLVVEPGRGFLADSLVTGAYTMEVTDSAVAAVGTAGVRLPSATRFNVTVEANAVNDYIISRTAGDFISAQAKTGTLKVRLTLYPPYGGASVDSVVVEDEARSNGETVAFDDVRAPGDGDFVVRLFNLTNSAGDVELFIPDGRMSKAIAVADGGRASDPLAPVGDDDIYTFTGVAGELAQVGCLHLGGTAVFRAKIYDRNGLLVQSNARRWGRIDSSGSGYEFMLPVAGTYICQVDTQEGDRTLPDDATAEFSVLKRHTTTAPVTFGSKTAGQVDRIDQANFTFSGATGDMLSIEVIPDPAVPTTMGPNRVALDPDMELYAPDGNLINSDLGRGNTRSCRFDDLMLPLSGMYKVVVFPNGELNGTQNPDSAGKFDIYLSDGSPAGATAKVVGTTVTGDLTPVADDDFYSFSGVAGELYQITLTRQQTTMPTLNLALYDSHNRLVGTGIAFNSVSDTQGRILAFSPTINDTYRIHVDVLANTNAPQNPSNYILGLFRREIKNKAANYGQSYNDTLGPVDIHKYMFSGNAENIVSFEAEPTSGTLIVDMELFTPFGVSMAADNTLTPRSARLDDVVLPYTGLYELQVYANGGENDAETRGNYTLYISDGPTEAPAALMAGNVMLGNLATKADDDLFTLNGTAGQRVKIELFRQDQVNGKPLALKLYDPNRILRGESTSSPQDAGGGELEVTLGMDGAFVVLVDCENVLETGTYSIIYNVIAAKAQTAEAGPLSGKGD